VSSSWSFYLPLYCATRYFYGNGNVLAANTIPFTLDCYVLYRHSLHNAGAVHPSTNPFTLGLLLTPALLSLWLLITLAPPLHTGLLLTLAPSYSNWCRYSFYYHSLHTVASSHSSATPHYLNTIPSTLELLTWFNAISLILSCYLFELYPICPVFALFSKYTGLHFCAILSVKEFPSFLLQFPCLG
jgi:hypothetical protein